MSKKTVQKKFYTVFFVFKFFKEYEITGYILQILKYNI
ncbi:hypothetical protein EMIT079MI2_150095 [Bacillus sp. IT-79MI2]|nr:hypothetical protein BTH41_01200 [Bacillus mycoides]